MPKETGTRAIVTGGDYFLSWQLADFLLSYGCQVILIGKIGNLPVETIREMASQEGLFLEEKPPSSFIFFKDLTKKFPKVDYLFCLDSFSLLSSPSLKNQPEDAKNFIISVKNLLKLSLYYRAKFLLASSLLFSQDNRFPIKGKTSSKDLFLADSFFEAQERAKRQTLVYFQQEKLNARIVEIGEVFGPKLKLDQQGEVTKIIREAGQGGPIKIPGDGRRLVAPLFVNDAVSGIARAMFAPTTQGEIFTLLGEEVPLLALAQKVKEKVLFGPEIEFVAEDGFQLTTAKGNPPPGWQPEISLEEGLKKTLKSLAGEEEKKLPEEQEKPEKFERKKRRFFSKSFLTIIFLIFFLLFLPFAFLGVNLFVGYYHLGKAAVAAEEVSFKKFSDHSQTALAAFSWAEETLSFLAPALDLVGFEKSALALQKNLFLGQMLAQTGIEGGKLVQETSPLFQKIISGQEVDFEEWLPQTRLHLQTFLDKASLTQSLLIQISDEDPFLGSRITKLRQVFPQVRKMGEEARLAIEVVPEILGATSRRTYLVLFQNNMEIRPTGGFIGSFGLLTFEKGRLLDFEIQDVYSIDGQLRGYVKPPAKLAEFLGLAGWYLRDSNWDPDFPTSALRAEWFLEKAVGRSVDGVLAVNLFVLEKTLEATGEVYLPDYEEKVNSSNFFERAQYRIEAGFFPGSTKKRDFLGSVANALFEKLKSSDEKMVAKVVTELYSSLERKDILIYLHQEETAEVISRLGWDGAIRQVNCLQLSPKKCLPDFLMLVEANVGINKANYYLQREIEYQVSLDKKGRLDKELVIEYKNQSPNDIFPAGRYKNYLRVLVPPESVLEKVVVKEGGQEKELKVDEEEGYGKKIFGFLVEVPVGEKKEVRIKFHLPEEEGFSEGLYVFLWQKQPGAFTDPFSFGFTFPENFSPQKMTSFLSLTKPGFLSYNGFLLKDEVFQIELLKEK